jgi:hypothetical protein
VRSSSSTAAGLPETAPSVDLRDESEGIADDALLRRVRTIHSRDADAQGNPNDLSNKPSTEPVNSTPSAGSRKHGCRGTGPRGRTYTGMGAHRRHEVGIRRAIEAAVGDDHAERGQHRKVPPEALAADRIEETIRHAVIVSSGSQPTRCWRGLDSNFQYAGAVNLVVAPLCRRKLGTRRCALSVFGQHDALHQSGVDPTAEAAIRAGDAQRRILLGSGRKRHRSTG